VHHNVNTPYRAQISTLSRLLSVDCALVLLGGLEYDVAQAQSRRHFGSTTDTYAFMTNGWACHKNSERLPPMRLDTMVNKEEKSRGLLLLLLLT
jgi:hypothetical protein